MPDDDVIPAQPRAARRGTVETHGGRLRVRCGMGGCQAELTWPRFTDARKLTPALRIAGWTDAVSGAWRCPACGPAAVEAGLAKVAAANAAERSQPSLFGGPAPGAVAGRPTPHVVIACGGRDFGDADRWWAALDRVHAKRAVTLLREGGAAGADWLARRWAETRGIAVDTVAADWERHGRAAGPLRNAAMLVREPMPAGVIAAPGGRGTADMVAKARAAGVPVWEPMG